MKIISNLLLFVLIFSATYCYAEKNGGSNPINRSFLVCLKAKPREKPILRPMVPRILPETALGLYNSGKAIFFAAGEAAIGANLPGAIPVTKSLIDNPSRLKRLKGKMIVIFCH